MNCQQLAARIEQLQPDLDPVDVARLCLLIFNQVPDEKLLADDEAFRTLWKQTAFRLEAATDQHAAIARELVRFGEDDPVAFDPEQLWMLLRAVKVQGQVLEMYVDQPALV